MFWLHLLSLALSKCQNNLIVMVFVVNHIMEYKVIGSTAFFICPDCGRTWQVCPKLELIIKGDPVSHQGFEGMTMTGLTIKEVEQ